MCVCGVFSRRQPRLWPLRPSPAQAVAAPACEAGAQPQAAQATFHGQMAEQTQARHWINAAWRDPAPWPPARASMSIPAQRRAAPAPAPRPPPLAGPGAQAGRTPGGPTARTRFHRESARQVVQRGTIKCTRFLSESIYYVTVADSMPSMYVYLANDLISRQIQV